jgi:uncharacterized membrane protein YidH (DUF202 family)
MNMNDTSALPLTKLRALKALSERYGCPWTEFSEDLNGPRFTLVGLDLESLKKKGWFPLAIKDGEATIIAHTPSAELTAEIKDTLGAETVNFLVTLPADLIRIIEHNQDINPGFSPDAGRTPLAKVRTYLAGRRSLFAHYRTVLAKSRTGLAFVRTGISFIVIAVLLFRILGGGLLLLLEIPLLAVGIVMAADSLRRYLPARRVGTAIPPCERTQATNGTTVLWTEKIGNVRYFRRSPVVSGADLLREGWQKLSPVMRRRYLASDRTDLAEERTTLACYRTWMGKVRTGLAFVRTGIAFIGLGLGLVRAFPLGTWSIFDFGLIAIGIAMMAEGFFWYFRGRQAGVEGHASVRRDAEAFSIWDVFFPHRHELPGLIINPVRLPVTAGQMPGIWGTTGHALERTLLGERRNVMARLRTTMARARTGHAFIRTGLSLFMIGVALELGLPDGALAWTAFDVALIASGLFLIVDGFVWSVPAERLRKQFPYCYADLEIAIADYGVPPRYWQKAVFSRESI